jgi:AcrR family transcriptional regulator
VAPRTRSTSNHTIARLASDALIAGGAEAVTFAEVAQRCGLAPPTLVQRFGTRSGLLEATAAVLAELVPAAFAAAPAHGGHLPRLALALQHLAPLQRGAARLAAEADMTAYTRELQKQISYLLAIAVEAGELPRCDIAQLARTLQICFAGAVEIAGMERRDVADEIAGSISMQLSIFV